MVRLTRYCARNPVALERLEWRSETRTVTYHSDKPTRPTATMAGTHHALAASGGEPAPRSSRQCTPSRSPSRYTKRPAVGPSCCAASSTERALIMSSDYLA